MLQTFFPAFCDSLNQSSLGSFLLNDLFFPDFVADACPEVSMNIGGERLIRLPILLLAACWGVRIGFGNAIQLLRVHRRGVYWSMAFGAFGTMNLSAIFIHCLWKMDNNSHGNQSLVPSLYPQVYPKLWMLDTYMTGFSSICLVIASLDGLFAKYYGKEKQHTSLLLFVLFWSLQGIGLGCCLWFLLKPEKVPFLVAATTVAATHPLELWYLLPPLLAGLPLLVLLFGDLVSPSASLSFEWTTGHLLLALGASLVGPLGIGMDRYWCWMLGSRFLDLFTAGTLTFVGCDLAFLGLQKWIMLSYGGKRKHVD